MLLAYRVRQQDICIGVEFVFGVFRLFDVAALDYIKHTSVPRKKKQNK